MTPSARRCRTLLLSVLLALAAGAALGPGSALAVNDCPDHGSTSWTNPSGGMWSVPGNWSNGVPGLTCTASITLPGNYTVVMDTGGGVLNLTLGAATGTQTLQILGTTVGGNPAGSVFRIDGGVSVGTTGVLQYTSSGGNPGESTTTGAGTITNSGLVRTDGPGPHDIQNNVVNNAGGTVAFHAATNTCGCGGTHLWANSGTVSTDAGVTASFTGTAGGVIFTQSDGTVTNAGRMFIGGGFTHAGGTTTGNPIELCGDLDPSGAGAATIEFAIENDYGCSGGSINADIGPGNTVLLHNTSVPSALEVSLYTKDVVNHGVLTMDSTPGAEQDQLIGRGHTLTNMGTINIAQDKSSQIQGPLVNAGTMNLTGGLYQNGAFTQQGGSVNIAPSGSIGTTTTYTQSGGTMNVDGLLSLGDASTLTGGTIQGAGTIKAAAGLTNSGGTVHPGHSPGVLTLTGDYTQGAGGTLAVGVAGTVPGTGYSQLAVSGTATLAGTLNVATTTPVTGVLNVLTATKVTGTFKPTIFSGEKFAVAYAPTAVTLSGKLTAPRPSKLSVKPSKLRGTGKATVTFRLAAPGAVTVLLSHKVSGHRARRHCRAGAKKGKRCTLIVTVAHAAKKGAAGLDHVTLRTHKVRPGRYTLTVRVRDAAGRLASASKTVSVRK